MKLRKILLCRNCGDKFVARVSNNEKFCGRKCFDNRGVTPKDIRFWEIGYVILPNGCHEWCGPRNHNNYGIIYRTHGKNWLAHRVGLEIKLGLDLDPSLVARHKCDYPPCVNFDHLEPGTHADNVADRMKRGRCVHLLGSAKPTAKLTEENVAEIRAAPKEIVSRVFAERFGVGLKRIRAVRRGDGWAHVIAANAVRDEISEMDETLPLSAQDMADFK